ncbi:hypothetical protein ABT136_34460, partial [Streptomyces sp. NPDC001856]
MLVDELQQHDRREHLGDTADAEAVAGGQGAARLPVGDWVDGYEPGNPWQSRLCVRTPYGTFAYPLTPN